MKITNPVIKPTPAELRMKYSAVYAWVEAQPWTSFDWVHVPIESVATLINALIYIRDDQSSTDHSNSVAAEALSGTIIHAEPEPEKQKDYR